MIKKLFITLLLVLTFAVPAMADGPFMVDAAYDAAINYFDIADEVCVGPNYTYGSLVWKASITGADLSAVNGAVDGRALQIAAQSENASGSDTCDTMYLYDVGTTTVLFYWPITEIAVTSGETYAFKTTTTPGLFKDIITTP